MNYDHNKKFGLLKFHLGYVKFNLNIPKGYSLKLINAQTGPRINTCQSCMPLNFASAAVAGVLDNYVTFCDKGLINRAVFWMSCEITGA